MLAGGCVEVAYAAGCLCVLPSPTAGLLAWVEKHQALAPLPVVKGYVHVVCESVGGWCGFEQGRARKKLMRSRCFSS